MSEVMEKIKEVNLRYIEELFEMYRSADRNGELAKMIKSWDEDWEKADAEFMQSNSKEDVDKRRLLCVQALFLAESSILFASKGGDPEQCEFYSLLKDKGSKRFEVYREAANQLIPKGDMLCLYMCGNFFYQVAAISENRVERFAARLKGYILPLCSFDDALTVLLAADAIESSLENDFMLGQAFLGKKDKTSARFYFSRVLTYNGESTLQKSLKSEANDKLEYEADEDVQMEVEEEDEPGSESSDGGQSLAKSARWKYYLPKQSKSALKCPECGFHTRTVNTFLKHLINLHETNAGLAGIFLRCSCGHESQSDWHSRSCDDADFTVIRKGDGPIRTKEDEKDTPQCIIDGCEVEPKNAYGYAYHLHRHHKTTLKKKGIYLKCACGFEVRRLLSGSRHNSDDCNGLYKMKNLTAK